MLRIRALRVGRKNNPSFRLIVAPQRTAPKTGRFLEILGFYNPIHHVRNLKKERIQYWLSKGAQPSDSAFNMLVSEGIMEGKKRRAHGAKKKKAEQQKEAAPSSPVISS